MLLRHIIILIGLSVLVASCGKPDVQEERFVSPELVAIDSLMWQRPDSALACLLPYFGTCRRDVSRNVSKTANDGMLGDVSGNISTIYNRHYAHLLLAELLYKNDSAQTNRTELRQAVTYLDSLTFTLNDKPRTRKRHCGLDPQSPDRKGDLFFLAARAHYIN